jgi:hypothetical protein
MIHTYKIVIKNPQMHETLNADPLDYDNSDYTNDWTKQHFFKYYKILDNTEEKKQNNNRNKKFHYKKQNVEDFTPYQDKQWEKDNTQSIIEKEEKEKPDLFNKKKQLLE